MRGPSNTKGINYEPIISRNSQSTIFSKGINQEFEEDVCHATTYGQAARQLKEDELVENVQAISDSLQETVDYVVDVLKLKSNEVEKLEELDQEELMSLAQRLNLRIMGMSEQEIEDIQNESDEEGLEQAQANE